MTSRLVTKEIFSRRATSERHGRARQLAPPAPVGVEPVDLARHHGYPPGELIEIIEDVG
jgi:hypothetical protein